MKLTVSITAYNHEKFISQALDSVLMQETDFSFEILIGEDDSEDNTREIVKEYQKQHPDKIRLFLNDRDKVIHINGRPTGRWNFVNNIKNAKGEYIALLEGDDFWTDPFKLQKQIDFLKDNKECTICFHNVEIFYEDENRAPWNYCLPNQKKISSLEDLLERNFLSTCSVVFDNGLFDKFPSWFYETAMGDWPLHILNSQHGKIGYLADVMAKHRINSNSYWSSHRQDQTLYKSSLVDAYQHFNKHLCYRYDHTIKSKLSKYYHELSLGYERDGDLTRAKQYLRKYAVLHHKYKKISSVALLIFLLRLHFPLIYGKLKDIYKFTSPADRASR